MQREFSSSREQAPRSAMPRLAGSGAHDRSLDRPVGGRCRSSSERSGRLRPPRPSAVERAAAAGVARQRAVDDVVGVVLVVVEHDQVLGAGGDRGGRGVGVRGEAAVEAGRPVGGRVGRVVDQHVGAAVERRATPAVGPSSRIADVGGVDQRARRPPRGGRPAPWCRRAGWAAPRTLDAVERRTTRRATTAVKSIAAPRFFSV